jgi:Holliday junction resolvasome RuvABC endonuclease subunit
VLQVSLSRPGSLILLIYPIFIDMPKRIPLAAAHYARPTREQPQVNSLWYMGVDQSSTNNGVAAYHSGTHTIYTTNFFCGKHNVELVERLYRLEHFLESVVNQIRPAIFYTEEVHPGNRHAYAVLLRVEMAVHSMLYRSYIPYSSISANVIQKESWPAMLKLKGTKEHIRLALEGIAPPLSTEHELDAVGVLLGSLVRDKLFKLESMKTLKIIREADCSGYNNKLINISK